MPRKTNAEKSDPTRIKENARLVYGEALLKLRTRITRGNVSDKNLVEIVKNLYPIIADDNTQTKTDVTMEMLAQKAVRVNLRIKQAGAEAQQEEAIEGEPDEKPEEESED